MIMKKFATVLFLASVFCIQAFAVTPLKMVYFKDGAPYSFSKDGKMTGILIDIVNEIIKKRMGIPVVHKGYPWARAQMLVKNGKADGFISVSTPTRKKYVETGKEPVIDIVFKMFVNAQNKKMNEFKTVQKLSDLKKFKLGSYNGCGWAKARLKNMDIDWSDGAGITVKKLIKRRFDIFIDATRGIRWNIKKLGYKDEIVELPQVLDQVPFILCIGKNSPHMKIISKFDSILKDIKKDGTWQKILDKY